MYFNVHVYKYTHNFICIKFHIYSLNLTSRGSASIFRAIFSSAINYSAISTRRSLDPRYCSIKIIFATIQIRHFRAANQMAHSTGHKTNRQPRDPRVSYSQRRGNISQRGSSLARWPLILILTLFVLSHRCAIRKIINSPILC